jgi:predicted ATPase
LQDDLARLIEAELILPIQSTPQDAAPYIISDKAAQPISAAPTRSTAQRYTFKHALVQEAAYASLLKHTRQVYHRRIAEMLETRFLQFAEARLEILAQHFAGAEMPAKAVDYWLRAGEHAKAQGATLEARTFFDRALQATPDGDRERRWQALLGLDSVFDLRVEREAQKMTVETLLEQAEACDDDTRRPGGPATPPLRCMG